MPGPTMQVLETSGGSEDARVMVPFAVSEMMSDSGVALALAMASRYVPGPASARLVSMWAW